MYVREAAGKKLTFGVSGMLWNHSLVMYDQETNSLWSHILGEAKQGRLAGRRLEQVPSVMTDWASWRKHHRNGTVVLLTRTSRNFTRQMYQRPANFVLGIEQGGQAKAWTLDLLQQRHALNDSFAKKRVLVAYDRASVTARLYDRNVQGKIHTFSVKANQLIDDQTKSVWEPITGLAVGGPLKGTYLKPLPAIMSFRRAWQVFHPRSQYGR